jgi:hypothetical protein
VLGGPVPLGRQQAGPAGAGHAAAQQEDVGLLAGLQDAELGVDSREVGDKPARVRLRAALGGRGLIPRGPPVTLGQPEHLRAEAGRREAPAVPAAVEEGGLVAANRRLPRRN